MSLRALLAVVLPVACGTLVACSPTIRKPQLLHPGPAPYQRGNAETFDPYPMPDMGPDIVGGRPREFQKPRNQVERAQDFLRSAGARPAQEVARTPVPIGAPVPIGNPVAVGPPATIGQPYPNTQPIPTLPAAPPYSTTPSGPRY